MSPKKRFTPFQKGHAVQYGLRVTDVDPKTKLTRSVVCRFCETFGREDRPGRKRKATRNAHYYTNPFRPENYRKHNESQHPSKWAEYQQLPEEKKDSLFAGVVPIKNTLLNHFTVLSKARVFEIDVGIKETIIGGMFFDVDDESDSDDDDDDGGGSCADGRRRPVLTPAEIKKRALSIFVPVHDDVQEDGHGPDGVSVAAYKATIKNGSLFDLVVEFASLGSSFRLIDRLAQSTKELTGMACYGGCNRRKVAVYLRVMCASNLQILGDCLARCWAFSLALDGATHQSTSYLDIRVRFCTPDGLHNCHLLALPLNDRHTGEAMFEMVVNVLDVIRPGWKDSLIGIATDGARNMTGRHAGLVTRLDRCTGPGFIRVWCGAHQLDLIMADIYGKMLQQDFFSVLTVLIGYLRRQQNLVADMKTTCPKVALTRWLSMIKVMNWFKKHRIDVQAHLDDKRPPCRPSSGWWVLMMAMHSFAQESSLVFTRIQGLTTLVSQQVAELSNLSRTFCRLVGGKGPLIQSEVEVMAQVTAESGGLVVVDTFAAPVASIELFIRGLGTFVSSKLDEVPSEDGVRLQLIKLVSTMFMSAAYQLTLITVERNEANERASPADQLPPVMPHELAKYSRADFCATVRKHILRLRAAKFTPHQIEQIEEEHGELVRAYHAEETLRLSLDACDATTSFKRGWGILGSRFPSLHAFAGGLATVFPGTSTVEADFSRLRREKSLFRQNLSDFGLECVLHSQQHKELQTIVAKM